MVSMILNGRFKYKVYLIVESKGGNEGQREVRVRNDSKDKFHFKKWFSVFCNRFTIRSFNKEMQMAMK